MTAETNRRRPLLAAFALIALIGSGSMVPLLFGGGGSDRPFTAAYVRAASRDSFTISAPVTLFDVPHVVLEKGTISLAAGNGGGAGTGAALTSLLTGGGADLILDDATLAVEQTVPGDPAPRAAAGIDSESAGPLVAALVGRHFEVLVLRRATIVIKMPGKREQTLRDVSAEIRSKPNAEIETKGTFRLRGEELTFDASGMIPNAKLDAPVPFRAAVKGALVDARLEGHFTRGERLQITSPNAELTVAKLREAARWLGADWPEGQGLGAFEAKGPLDWSEGALSFENARFSLDGNAATGALSVTLDNERPKVEGTLAFNSLNLAPYLRASEASSRSLTADWLSFIRTPGSLSSSLIREIDADLRISVKSVVVADQSLGRCAASLSIKDGKLFADIAEIELDHGGTGDGQFGVDVTGGEPRYSVRGRLESFDVGRAVGQRFGRSTLEGFGTLDVDLAGEGRTGDAILASLSGTVEVDMPEGARLGLNVERLAAAAAAPSQPGIWGVAAEGATSVESLVAKFAGNGGVFKAESVKADAGAKVVTAAGTVSVAERALDVTVSIADEISKSSSQSSATPPTEGFRLQGPWAAPTVGPIDGMHVLPAYGPSSDPASPSAGAPGDRG